MRIILWHAQQLQLECFVFVIQKNIFFIKTTILLLLIFSIDRNALREKKGAVAKKMSSNSASLQHILISVQEYDRLKNIEKQYQKLHEGIEEKLQITSKI